MESWNRMLCSAALLIAATSLADTRISSTRAEAAPAAQARASSKPADLVLRGGKIVTVDDARPTAEAIAVTGDTIVAVGSNEEIQRYIGPNTRVIDLNGALAVPGLIDAHVHFTGVGEAARNLKLADREELGRHRPHGRRGGEAARNRANGFWAAAGIRRNGRRRPRPTSKAFRFTKP